MRVAICVVYILLVGAEMNWIDKNCRPSQSQDNYSCISLCYKEHWEPKNALKPEWFHSICIRAYNTSPHPMHTHTHTHLQETGRIAVQETACSHVF